jgi:hypothetical protein
MARVQRTANRWRNGARLAPDIERLPLLILHYAYHARVTREPSGDFGCQGGTVLEFTASGNTLTQCLGVDVDHDLVSLPAVENRRSVLQKGFRDATQGIGAPRGQWGTVRRFRGNVDRGRGLIHLLFVSSSRVTCAGPPFRPRRLLRRRIECLDDEHAGTGMSKRTARGS